MQIIKAHRNFYASMVLLLLTSLVAQGQSDKVMESLVQLNLQNKTVIEVLEAIEEQTDFSFFYNPKDLKNESTFSFDNNAIQVKTVLEKLFLDQDIEFKPKGNRIVLVKNSKEKKEIGFQSKFTLSGTIMDEASNETMIGATVFCKELQVGTSSNEYGFYSLTLPEGTYEIEFTYVGYSSKVETIVLDQNISHSAFVSFGNKLEEIVVKADAYSARHAGTRMSSNKISIEKMKSIPALMGERDVLKMIQLMPGVQSGSEGTSGLYVRGGGPDQNLMLLDGVPVYNASHLFGFLSTFNGDAVKSVELIKGGFPARHGGRLSSIVDVRMKEGNMKKIHGDFTMGLLSGRFNLEGPIVKEKTSFSFSGRRTWLDLITTPLQKIGSDEKKSLVTYKLYDINTKINHKFSDKSRIYLSSYIGNDKLNIFQKENNHQDDGYMDWGNRILTTRWNYQINPKLFSNTTLYISNYKFNFYNEFLDQIATPDQTRELYSSNSNIRDYGAKLDFNYVPHPNHYIRTGLKYGNYDFTPTTTYFELKEGQNPAESSKEESPKVSGKELNLYVEDDMIINNHLNLNIGVHAANFTINSTNHTSVQPRVALSYLLNEKSSLKFSATKMTQFLHLLASPGLGLPTDLWVSSTEKIKPEHSWQYGAAYTRSLGKGYELTLEGFYKDMTNLITYKSGFNFFNSSEDWENKVDVGQGKSFGGELLLEKTTGKTTGWIGYTLSKSTRNFPNIGFGKSYPYKYDRRHDIGIAITHKKSKSIEFGLVWVYGTGNTYTLGGTNYSALGLDDRPTGNGKIFGSLGTANYIASRNNQRMPAYHRLDLSVNWHKVKKRGTRTWSFGVYNAYARQNPFLVYTDTSKAGIPILKQTSLIPILPYFSYSFKF